MSSTTAGTTSTAASPIPTDPTELLLAMAATQASIRKEEAMMVLYKQQLDHLRDIGLIDDKLEEGNISVTLHSRKFYSYSDAVDRLKDLERIEGVATEKTTSSWTLRIKS